MCPDFEKVWIVMNSAVGLTKTSNVEQPTEDKWIVIVDNASQATTTWWTAVDVLWSRGGHELAYCLSHYLDTLSISRWNNNCHNDFGILTEWSGMLSASLPVRLVCLCEQLQVNVVRWTPEMRGGLLCWVEDRELLKLVRKFESLSQAQTSNKYRQSKFEKFGVAKWKSWAHARLCLGAEERLVPILVQMCSRQDYTAARTTLCQRSQTAGRNNRDTHSFARWKWRLLWLQCRVWDMTAKWNGMSNLQMDAVIVNDECNAFRMLRRAAHGPARFYFELFSIWMSEATYYTGWLCFGIDGIWSYQDPGEKYCLASTDWWQLVRLKCGPATCKVYEFWKWICKMFRNENRATMKFDCTSHNNYLCDSIADVMAQVLLGI